jgi:AmiR/NasT family two-component response regulator
VVSNADMTFASRQRSDQGPTKIAEQTEVDMAIGVLMAERRIPPDRARQELEAAAERAGSDVLSVARAILGGLSRRRSDEA